MTAMIGWVLTGLLLLLPQAAPRGSDPSRAGWDALLRRDGEAAAAAFRTMLEANPNDARALTGAGLAEQLLGHEVQAVAFLKRAVEVDPRHLDAYDALGRIAYAQGDLTSAINWYERLVKLAPGGPAASRLEAWKKEAALHDTLIAQPTARFTVLFEGETQQAIANHVSEVLEAAYDRIGRALNAFPPNAVTVILYTGEQFKDITQSPAWASGAYDGRIRIPVAGAMTSLAELDRVVTHEFVHALLRQVYPRIPKWLNEGLATHFEPGGHQALLGKLPGPTGAIPLARLNQAFETADGAEAAIAYAQSYAATRLLVDRLGTGLPVFLQYLTDGTALDEAVMLFNLSVSDLEQAWTRRDYE